jgi:hypothetical protein
MKNAPFIWVGHKQSENGVHKWGASFPEPVATMFTNCTFVYSKEMRCPGQ